MNTQPVVRMFVNVEQQMTCRGRGSILGPWLLCAQASGFPPLDQFPGWPPLRTCERSIATRRGKAKFHAHRSVVIESAVNAIFAVWPLQATVTSFASPGFVSTSTIEPSGFFA